jgi:hypothetical protein
MGDVPSCRLAACVSVSMPFQAICDWLGQVQYSTAQVGAELQEIIVHRDIGPSTTAPVDILSEG